MILFGSREPGDGRRYLNSGLRTQDPGLGLAIICGAPASTPIATGQAPPASPLFRSGVDVLTVDVTALDGNGRQVTHLIAADFTVEVDGDARQSSGPSSGTAAADRARAERWAKAYAASNGPMQPLVTAWARHLEKVQ